MVVGLPGTGIGGIFYILLAFIMPVREAFLVITGKGISLKRWMNCGLQVLNASGVLAGMYVMGWALGWLVELFKTVLAKGWAGGHWNIVQVSQHSSNMVSSVAAYMAIVTLVAVVGGIEILSLVLKTRGTTWAVRPNAESAK
ncbi:MAG: hypothetical protein WC869_15325 [Phycisphaerae bacterium]|jgi:hypothetical protein